MRLNIYLYSNDPRFFYRVNDSFKKLKLPIRVLNFGTKFRKMDGIILTTKSEYEQFSLEKQNDRFLVYSETQDFEEFIMKVLATHKLGYVDNYSEIIFSIDPGYKKSGVAIFIDEYFLKSEILFKQVDIIELIKNFTKYFNSDEGPPVEVKIFFGAGVPSLVDSLLKGLREELKEDIPDFYLIDESFTSKIKFNKKLFKISKHEYSALKIAIRGVNALKNNLLSGEVLKQNKKFQTMELVSELEFTEILEKEVFFGYLSISDALERL